jgi:hypothetical protein
MRVFVLVVAQSHPSEFDPYDPHLVLAELVAATIQAACHSPVQHRSPAHSPPAS